AVQPAPPPPPAALPSPVPLAVADAQSDISRADPPGQLRYVEGTLVGHRWYLSRDIAPRWWFGEGRGYTSHLWGAPSPPDAWSPGAPLQIVVPVTNTGARSGSEVVQAYVQRPD